MKLEIKKYKLTKYIKGIFIATVCIIAFITVSLIDSMTDPKQTKDTYDSIIRMLNLLVTGTFVIFSSVLTAKYIIGEYKDRTILLMFTYPIKREKIMYLNRPNMVLLNWTKYLTIQFNNQISSSKYIVCCNLLEYYY